MVRLLKPWLTPYTIALNQQNEVLCQDAVRTHYKRNRLTVEDQVEDPF